MMLRSIDNRNTTAPNILMCVIEFINFILVFQGLSKACKDTFDKNDYLELS